MIEGEIRRNYSGLTCSKSAMKISSLVVGGALLISSAGVVRPVRAQATVAEAKKTQLRQVEVEVNLVAVSPADFAALGVEFPKTEGPAKDGLRLGKVHDNFAAALPALQTEKRAEVLSSPRMTIINNANGVVEESRSQEFLVAMSAGANDQGVHLFKNRPSTQTMERITTFKMFVTSTINNDDTVTMLLNPTATTRFGLKGSKQAEEHAMFSATAIVSAKDGETVALTGFDPNFVKMFLGLQGRRVPILGNSNIPSLSDLFRAKQLVVFITPRIVRRADEKPKTQ